MCGDYSINGVGIIGQVFAQNLRDSFIYSKVNSKLIRDLNVKNKTLKEIELNLYYHAYHLEVEKILLGKTQNQEIKKEKQLIHSITSKLNYKHK